MAAGPTGRDRRVAVLLALVVTVAVGVACGPGVGSGPTTTSTDGTTADRRTTISYGDAPDQFVEVFRPPGEPVGPTVVLVHGGFWREQFRADLMVGLAEDLVARGMVAVNVEYRRVGGAGGWPATLADVAAAVDLLGDDEALGALAGVVDPARVVTVGHSAGGHLAVWAASRHRIPDELVAEVGGAPAVRPCGAVSQAGVVSFADALSLGGGAVVDLLGGTPGEVPTRYAAADPAALVPTGVPVRLVHGEDDDIVPVSQSERYAEIATDAGDDADVVVVPGDHFVMIDATTEAWATVVAAIGAVDAACGGGA